MADMEGALPENDGMQSLRYKLQEIKMLAVSTEEKAKRMHSLMMKDYHAHKESALLPPSPRSIDGGNETDGSISPMLGAAAMPIDPKNPYNLRPGDLDPVFTPLPKAPRDIEGDTDEAMIDDEPELGCMHYKRNVKVQCFDCQRWFPCRHCHDQAKDLPFPHALNRKKTQNMLCMLCRTPQPAAEACANCEQYAAWYYCPKCKLWDNDSNKRIYHCDDCGICRVGEGLGKDFVHCKRCNVCISIATSAAHPCIERATDGDCPLCLMHMFEARVPVVSLPCGHYMHGDCYKDLMAVTYKCPVCSKSAVNMELQWRKLDDEIAAQPMPDDDGLEGLLPPLERIPQPPESDRVEEAPDAPQPRRPRQVWVGCNDCGARTWTNFHWLGLKCGRCDSYNTNQMAPTAFHESEAERLLRQEQQSHRQHDFTGNAALREAGIGLANNSETEQYTPTALDIPESPSQQPLSSSPRLAAGAQSPGRYFVTTSEEIRRPSFSGRFSAPSMPNLPTLSSLSADMPRMPRLPNLPNSLQNMRQNFPNMPNVSVGGFSPYEMIDAFSRSLSPMRYYLRGLDVQDLEEGEEVIGEGGVEGRQRPGSVQSDSAALRRGSKLRGEFGEGDGEEFEIFETSDDEEDFDVGDDAEGENETGQNEESSGEESAGELSDAEMVDGEEERDGRDFEIFGHR